MLIFVTGAYGALGNDVVVELKSKGYSIIESDIYPKRLFDINSEKKGELEPYYLQLNLSEKKTLSRVFDIFRPDVVIPCSLFESVKRGDCVSGKAEKEDEITNIIEAATGINARIISVPKENALMNTKDLARVLVESIG